MANPTIRRSKSSNLKAIEAIYPAAFPDEDLLPLVRRLLDDNDAVLSLVAEIDSRVIGHVALTLCSLDGSDSNAALLGPLAVDPEYHRQGIGSALTHTGLNRLREDKTDIVCVLGDPAYYGRFGFTQSSIKPPYELPAEWASAWQALSLSSTAEPKGRLSVPAQWQVPSLWQP